MLNEHKENLSEARYIASGVAIFTPESNPELGVLLKQGHTHDPILIVIQIPYAGSSGAPEGHTPPTAIFLALSGLNITGPISRAAVGVSGYVPWANYGVFAKHSPDDQGFWAVVQVDSDCTVDKIQVDWLAYWI